MPLLRLVLVLIVVGVLLWLVNVYVPMNAAIKGILNAVVIIAVILFVLNAFELLGPLARLHLGR